MRPEERDHRVAEVGERHVEPARLVPFAHVASALAAGPDADHVHRAMAHAVVAVAGEVLGGELPVAGDQPLVGAADDLGASLAPVPRVEEKVEVELVAAEIALEGGRRPVPGRPDRPLVVLHLGDFDETPARPVKLGPIGVLREGNAHESAVGAITPAVIRALKLDGVPLIVAAHLHPPVPARIQEDMHFALSVAAHDDRLVTHP